MWRLWNRDQTVIQTPTILYCDTRRKNCDRAPPPIHCHHCRCSLYSWNIMHYNYFIVFQLSVSPDGFGPVMIEGPRSEPTEFGELLYPCRFQYVCMSQSSDTISSWSTITQQYSKMFMIWIWYSIAVVICQVRFFEISCYSCCCTKRLNTYLNTFNKEFNRMQIW